MNTTRKIITQVLKEEGFEYNRRKRYWFTIHSDSVTGIQIFPDLVLAQFRLMLPGREELPRYLADDARGESCFGFYNWYHAIKPILARLLASGK